MPSPKWTLLTLSVAAVGLLRRRAVPAEGAVERLTAARVPSSASASLSPDDPTAAARPTPSAIQAYAYHGCTDREIADRFGLAEADVRGQFAAVLSTARGQRAFALRRAQTELATGTTAGGGKAAGNATLLTWLGRNELGQALSPAARGEPEPEVEG